MHHGLGFDIIFDFVIARAVVTVVIVAHAVVIVASDCDVIGIIGDRFNVGLVVFTSGNNLNVKINTLFRVFQ